MLSEINDLRVARGLVPLRTQATLARAAGAHSVEMVRLGYFGHDSADGTGFRSRIVSFYPRRTLGAGWRAGENLAWQEGAPTASSLVDRWLASPSHRANLFEPRFREVGISAARSAHAPGVYGGRTVTVVTADFGAR